MANIFAQYAQPVRSVMDYQADFDAQDIRREQLGGAKRTNAMADLTAQQQRQTMADTQNDNALIRAAYARSGSDPKALTQALRMAGTPGTLAHADAVDKRLGDASKLQADTDKSRADSGKTVGETADASIKRYRGALDFIDTPDGAKRWLAAQYQDPALKSHMEAMGPIDEAAKRIPTDPQGFQQWRKQAGMGMDAYQKYQQEQAKITETGRHNVAGERILVSNNAANNATTQRGQNMTAGTAAAGQRSVAETAAAGRGVTLQVAGMTDARARDKNSIDQSAVGKVDWKQDTDGNWIALPKEVKTGDAVTPIATTAPGKRAVQAGHALDIIAEARGLIDKGTGSYAGAAIDQAARVVGASTKGGEVAAKLKALEGALMMAQPRMEGPQSNMDVLLYKQMAGQIGDSTLPAGNKKAAIDTIEKLHTKYKNGGQSLPAAPAAATGNFSDAEKEARYQAWKAKQK